MARGKKWVERTGKMRKVRSMGEGGAGYFVFDAEKVKVTLREKNILWDLCLIPHLDQKYYGVNDHASGAAIVSLFQKCETPEAAIALAQQRVKENPDVYLQRRKDLVKQLGGRLNGKNAITTLTQLDEVLVADQ